MREQDLLTGGLRKLCDSILTFQIHRGGGGGALTLSDRGVMGILLQSLTTCIGRALAAPSKGGRNIAVGRVKSGC